MQTKGMRAGLTIANPIMVSITQGLLLAVPVFLLFCVRERVQHVGQRRECQIQPINMMLAEGGHAALWVSCDVALDGLQLP